MCLKIAQDVSEINNLNRKDFNTLKEENIKNENFWKLRNINK